MIKHEIPQRSLEWLELKHGKIGGTLSKGLFVKSDTLLIDILSQLTEDFEAEDSYISYDMQRGIDLEPYALEALSSEIFVSFTTPGFLQNKDIPLIGISPDGLSECDTIACEIKCPGAKKHMLTILEDAIPSDNIHQCLHYFTVNPKLETLYFVSYRPESKIKQLWYNILTRSTDINLGTKAKPVVKTVDEWSKIAKTEAEILEAEIQVSLSKLNNLK